MQISNSFVKNYQKSHYRIVGKYLHSAIKPCHWLEQRLLTGRENRNCYKGYFGIKSHLCLQNTPALPFCNQSCAFCWRDIEQGTLGSDFSTTPDNPKYIIDEMIRQQRDILDHHFTLNQCSENLQSMRIIANLMKDRTPRSLPDIVATTKKSAHQVIRAVKILRNTQVLRASDDLKNVLLHPVAQALIDQGQTTDSIIEKQVTTEKDIRQTHAEAHQPTHAAISLGGEPILYPQISEFVAEFRRRNFTTFIVTNGTRPDLLKKMDTFPTQLYVSMPVSSPEDYERICRPAKSSQWTAFLETLDMLPSLSCRTCVRITALQGINLENIEAYVKLIQRANPNFIDLKAFTLEASSLLIGKRLQSPSSGSSYVPTWEHLQDFAQRLSLAGHFPILDQVKKSRDILLGCNWNEEKSILIERP